MATKTRTTSFANSIRLLLINTAPTKPSWRQRYANELKDRNLTLPTWLLVLYMISIGGCIEVSHNSLFAIATKPGQSSCYAPFESNSKTLKQIIPTLHSIVLLFMYPFMGWLADAKIGRSRVITISLWLSWLGTALQITSYCIQYSTCGLPANIAKYGISSGAFLLMAIGTSSMLVNVLAYGMDHLVDASNSKVRAFVHWIVWGLFVGFLNGYIAFVEQSIEDVTLLLVTALVTFSALSCAVITHTCLRHRFLQEYNQDNPYYKMFSVLIYAMRHTIPENRSAFTYWEEKEPGRLDLGKEKYGGPFKESDIEDVKATLKVIAIILSLFGFYISFFAIFEGFPLINKLEGAQGAYRYASYILWDTFNQVLIILIPVFELVLIPLLPKIEYFLLNPLRGIGVAYLLLLTSLVTMFIIDSSGEIETQNKRNTSIVCYLNSQDDTLDLSFYYYAIPLFFSGLASALSFVYSLEFICSQAPIKMSGMLTGFYFSMRSFYGSIGSLITIIFTNVNVRGPADLSCSFYVLTIQIVICVAGYAVYIIVARWYKRRKRNDDYNTMAVLEKTYEGRFTTSDDLSNSQPSENSVASQEDYFHCLEEYVIETLTD